MSSEGTDSVVDSSSTQATSVSADDAGSSHERGIQIDPDVEAVSPDEAKDESNAGSDVKDVATVSPSDQVRRLLDGALATAADDDEENIAVIKNNLTDEVAYDSLKRPLRERKKESSKRNLQALSYILLMEDRLKELEGQVKDLQDASKVAKDGDKDGSDQRGDTEAEAGKVQSQAMKQAILVTTPEYMGWAEFVDPPAEEEGKPKHVLEVLTEHPHPLLSKAARTRQSLAQHHGVPADTRKASGGEYVERIRINSDALNDLIARTLGLEESPSRSQTHVRPFKFLLASGQALQDELMRRKSESKEDEKPSGSHTVHTEGDLEPQTESTAATAGAERDGTERDSTDRDSTDRKDGSEPGEPAYGEKLTEHLECLIKFLETDLSAELQACRQLRAREKRQEELKVEFAHLWHLFRPGDVVYDPIVRQAYQVLFATGGRKMLPKAVESSSSLARKEKKEMEIDRGLVVDEEAPNPFTLTCFHLDFDGKNYGPLQREISIPAFDLPRPIRSLQVYPIEYVHFGPTSSQGKGAPLKTGDPLLVPIDATDSDHCRETSPRTFLNSLEKRGKKFARLTSSREVAHKEYVGFSLDVVREQIDSQIIIDLELFYEKFPEKIPHLGISEPGEGSLREVQESYYVACVCEDPGCTLRSYEDVGNVYDDRVIDKTLMSTFKAENPGMFGVRGDGKAKLEREWHYLLPKRVHGYVLRSRTWCALDVDEISDFKPRKESFGQLVLPKQHKDIVEGLVKTHSRGPVPVKGAQGDPVEDRRDDLVRGKGKGLIILLHGVPGVGKTSTAECVAEYTGRPLFALTCGDIGDTAREVQTNLTENFQLAHRWGCVMLLDEADVFLQQRDKANMQRNAVVSVFLRILEYYSGILFLTTNKVGTFDEAFKSRIHISLYYKQLNRKRSRKIWQVNFDRLRNTRKDLKFDEDDLLDWVKKTWEDNEELDLPLRPWNGRQIHNACQTAAALAEFQSQNVLTEEHLEAVAKTSREFDEYLKSTHGGDDFDRARKLLDRADDKYQARFGSPPPRGDGRVSQKSDSRKKHSKSKKRDTRSEESSSESESESDSEKERKKRKKQKKRDKEREAKSRSEEGKEKKSKDENSKAKKDKKEGKGRDSDATDS